MIENWNLIPSLSSAYHTLKELQLAWNYSVFHMNEIPIRKNLQHKVWMYIYNVYIFNHWLLIDVENEKEKALQLILPEIFLKSANYLKILVHDWHLCRKQHWWFCKWATIENRHVKEEEFQISQMVRNIDSSIISCNK